LSVALPQRRLPHPFPPRDRAAGYRYALSILQAEFSLTQVLDQPVTGRIFFEEVIGENLDLGRPSQVSLVFDRKVTRRTPGPPRRNRPERSRRAHPHPLRRSVRASVARHAGTLGCRHRHWWSP
jgi:hypothetical protein